MRLMKRIGPLVLILAASFLPAIGASATQQPPVQVSAVLGFANFVKPLRPLPFQLDLTAGERAIEGEAQLIDPGAPPGTLYRVPISLAPKSHKRWRLTLPPITGNTLRVVVLDSAHQPIADQVFNGLQLKASSPLVVVVQEKSSRYTLPRKARDPQDADWRSTGIEPESLPDNALGYASVSALLWRVDQPPQLSEAQSQALVQWLQQGGLLVLAGGRCVPPNLPVDFPWLARWGEMESLPIDRFQDAAILVPERPITMPAHKRNSSWRHRDTAPGEIAIRPLTGETVEQEIAMGKLKIPALVTAFAARMLVDGKCVITEQIVGGGLLMQLAFDPFDLKDTPIETAEFWDEVLSLPDPRHSAWESLAWLSAIAGDASHLNLAQIADYRVASLVRVTSIFGVFFSLAFCLNFWLFRKSRRYEWAWLILGVSSVALFFYNRTYGRVGGWGPTRHVEMSLAYAVAGQKQMLSFTHTGILSPRSRAESLTTLSRAQLLFGSDNESRAIEIAPDRQTFPFRTKPGAFVTCSSVGLEPLPGNGFAVRWEKSAQKIKLIVTNQTEIPMAGLNLMLVSNPQLQESATGSHSDPGHSGCETWEIPAARFKQWRAALLSATVQATADFQYNTDASLRGSYQARQFGGSITSVNSTLSGINIPGPYLALRCTLPSTQQPATASGASFKRSQKTLFILLPLPIEVATAP